MKLISQLNFNSVHRRLQVRPSYTSFEHSSDALAGQVFARAGYEVHQVQDSYSALQILAEHPVDLVLAVVTMPGMAGLELAEVMRRLHRLAETPVLGVSSVPQAYLAPRIAVFDAFLQRPFSIVDLLEQVSDLLALTGLPGRPHLLSARFNA